MADKKKHITSFLKQFCVALSLYIVMSALTCVCWCVCECVSVCVCVLGAHCHSMIGVCFTLMVNPGLSISEETSCGFNVV